jgi:hypothetical protein
MLAKISGNCVGVRDGAVFAEHVFSHSLQADGFSVSSMNLAAGTHRQTLDTTVGATMIYLSATAPVRIYLGRNILGYDHEVYMGVGSFPEGVCVDSAEDTEITIVTAR